MSLVSFGFFKFWRGLKLIENLIKRKHFDLKITILRCFAFIFIANCPVYTTFFSVLLYRRLFVPILPNCKFRDSKKFLGNKNAFLPKICVKRTKKKAPAIIGHFGHFILPLKPKGILSQNFTLLSSVF